MNFVILMKSNNNPGSNQKIPKLFWVQRNYGLIFNTRLYEKIILPL